MSRIPYPVKCRFFRFALIGLSAAGLAAAQDQTPPPAPQTQAPSNAAWRRVGDPPPPPAPVPAAAPAPAQAPAPGAMPPAQDPSQPTDRTDAYGQPLPAGNGDMQEIPQDAPPPQQMAPQGAPPMAPQGNRPAYGIPASVTLQGGTYITMRTNQPLSTSHNLVGDAFSGTLIQPVVVNGIVVAQRGQTVYGRVTQVEKQHSDKPSRLGLELTGITLADGTQLPVKTQLVNRQGGSTPGPVQAGTIVGTTAVGAAIGGAVGWGTGAAIGTGAGALVGIAGVLATHNHPTILYPETALTFQTSAPVTVATGNAPQAFHYVSPNEYGVQMQMQPARPPYPGYTGYPGAYGAAPYGAAPYAAAPYPYYPYPYPYYYPYYPYWGGVGFYFGGPRGFFGPRGFRR